MPAPKSSSPELPARLGAKDDMALNYGMSQSATTRDGAEALVDKANAFISNDSAESAKELLSLRNLLPAKPCLITVGYADTPDSCNGYLKHVAREVRQKPQDYVLILDGFHARERSDELVSNRKVPGALAGVTIESLGVTRMEEFYLGYDLITTRLQAAIAGARSGDSKKKQLDQYEKSCAPLLIDLAVQLAKGKALLKELEQKWNIASQKLPTLVMQISALEVVLRESTLKDVKNVEKQFDALQKICAQFRDLTVSLMPFAKRLQTETQDPNLQKFRQFEEDNLRTSAAHRIHNHLAEGKTVVLRASASMIHSGNTGLKKNAPVATTGFDALVHQTLSKAESPPVLHLAILSSTKPQLSYEKLVAKSAFGDVQTNIKLITIPSALFSQ